MNKKIENIIGFIGLLLALISIIVQYSISNAIEKGSAEREFQNQEFLKKQDEIQKMHSQLETVKILKTQALISYASNCANILKRAYEKEHTSLELTSIYTELYYQHGVLNELFNCFQSEPSHQALDEYYTTTQSYTPLPPKWEVLNNLEKHIHTNIQSMNQEIITIETFHLD